MAVIVGIAASGAATAGTVLNGTEAIGVCHATGDADGPFVFLLVPEDGFEHGHHRNHGNDFFIDPTSGVCSSDVPLGVDATEDTSVDDASDDALEGPAVEDPTDVTDATAGDDGTPAGDGSGDADDSTDDGADDGADDADAPTTDGTVDQDNGTEDHEPAPPAGDIAVSQSADQDDHQVILTIVVESVGTDNVSDVSLYDALPDVRRPWLLSGADASDCTLEGNDLSCWFGEVPAGESRIVTVHAYTDRIPCGESMTSTAWIEAADDVESRNDASSAGILARYC